MTSTTEDKEGGIVVALSWTPVALQRRRAQKQYSIGYQHGQHCGTFVRLDTYLKIGVGFHSTWLLSNPCVCMCKVCCCCWPSVIMDMDAGGSEWSLGMSNPADTGGVIG